MVVFVVALTGAFFLKLAKSFLNKIRLIAYSYSVEFWLLMESTIFKNNNAHGFQVKFDNSNLWLVEKARMRSQASYDLSKPVNL